VALQSCSAEFVASVVPFCWNKPKVMGGWIVAMHYAANDPKLTYVYPVCSDVKQRLCTVPLPISPLRRPIG
jgi:hypothetical protein